MTDRDGVGPPPDRHAAAAQLAALRADRAALAERAGQAWWYDAVVGLLVFGFVSSAALVSTWVSLAAVAVLLLCTHGLIELYRRRTGFWVSGLRGGRGWRVLYVGSAVAAVVLVEGLAAHDRWRGSMVVVGAVLGVVAALVSRWSTHRYAAELREGL